MPKVNIRIPLFVAAFLALFLVYNSSFAAINIVISSDQSSNIDLSTDSDSTLDLEGGTLTGTVTMGNAAQVTAFSGGNLDGTIKGPGRVVINFPAVTLGGNFGTDASYLTLVTINENNTLNTVDKHIKSDAVIISSGATLNYSSGDLISDVDGASSGVGSFIFNNTKTTKFTLGQNNLLANIDVMGGITVNLGSDAKHIAARDINISGTLKTNGQNVFATNINLNSGATFNIDIASTLSGAINGSANGYGEVQFSGSGSYDLSSNLGENYYLQEVEIKDDITINLSSNIYATQITIGDGDGGTLNQNSGILGIDNDSLIRLNTDAILNYNGGTINGTIRGTSSGKGVFNINANYTNNSEIGATYDIANLNIASGAALNANADISANNTDVAGELNLGNISKTIDGNLFTSNSGAVINLGSASHIVTGNFTLIFGNNLNILALNNTNAGSIAASGAANVADNINLNISFNPNDGYISDATTYELVSGGDGSVINKINDENININSSGLNQYGLLTFRTLKSNNDLILSVSRAKASSITGNKSAQNIYNNIDEIGSGATGNLREFQKYIDNDSATNEERDIALKSLIPQIDNAIHQSVFNSAKTSIGITKSRLERLRGKLFFKDDIFESHGIWGKIFNANLAQDSNSQFDGYKSNSRGIIFGADQMVEEDTRLGVSASYVNSSIDSNSSFNRNTKIDSYQFNVYAGYNLQQYFINYAIGVVVNKYSSSRSIPLFNLQSKASYDGQTYISHLEGGLVKKLNNGFELSPKISLTLARNQVGTYSEIGAGTLSAVVSNEKANLLETELTIGAAYNDINLYGLKIIPKVNLSSSYDFIGDNQVANNNFVEQDAQFRISARDINKFALKMGFGLDIYSSSDVVFMANYLIEQRSSYKSSLASVNLRYDFW